MTAKKIVLDSYAVLMYLNDEHGADLVEKIFRESGQGKLELIMNEINLGEVFYQIGKKEGLEIAEERISEIRMLPISWIIPDRKMIFDAANFKAKFPISYADGFVAATCVRCEGTVITGDPEFKNLEEEIKIEWLPQKSKKP